MKKHKLIIAVDFDGTIVDHMFPIIGPERLNAFYFLRKLKEEGHKLILWTCREGVYLQHAIDYCEHNGVTFDAVNDNVKGINFETSRKIYYDLLVDDRNLKWYNDSWESIYNEIQKVIR